MRYLNFLLLLISPTFYAQIPAPTSYIYVDDIQPWTNGSINISGVDKVVYYNSTSANANVDIKAAKEILLQPNASAVNFNNNGSFTAEIKQSYLNPAAFKSPLGYDVYWNSIYLFDRFEIGVQLPPNINQLIEDFLNGNNTGINPYDQDQIKLVGTYYQQGIGSQKVRYGFYYRDIRILGNGYVQQQSNYPFRIRFAPQNTGDYRLHLELYVAGSKIDETYCDFTVKDLSKYGFWSLNSMGKLKDSRNHEIFAIGQNVAFANPCTNNQNDLNCSFDEQRSYINELAINQGNLVRIRLDPWSNDIEWEELGVYGSNRIAGENFKRQYHAYQLDQTFDLCEQNGMYIFLTLMQDQTLNPLDHYGTGYAWPLSPYSSVIANPQDFLTDAAARLAFKKKLDYIIARYGYSANLGMYSILNEANGVENWQNSSSVRTDMMNWHCEMSSYLKNTYPQHLITTGYTQTGTSKTNSLIKEDNTFVCGSIDIASCNHYSTSRDLHKERHDEIPKRVSNNWNANLHTNIKPFIFGELGMTDCQPYSDQFTDAEFHNTIWSTSMYDNAIGSGLYWYDWEQKQGINHRINFNALKNFTTDLNLSTDAYVSKWDFGGSAIKQNRKIEYIESHNTGRAKGYGWVKNADYFWINDPFLLSNFPNNNITNLSCNETEVSNYSYSHHFEEITLHGLQALKRYNIDFWSCYGNGGNSGTGGINNKWSTIFGTLNFYKDVSVGPNIAGDPDFAYKLAKIGTNFRTINTNDPPTDTIRLYKGRNCFEASGLQDDSDNNTHYWDFGDGQTSNLMDPLVCYEKPGKYLVVHNYKDTIGNNVTQSQNIIVIFKEETKEGVPLANDLYDLQIFPNPTLNVISLVSSQIISDIYVYNQLGEILLIKQKINLLEFQVNEVANFKTGTYFVKVVYQNGDNGFKKFIKIQ
ncbi:MAG: PKD domain-containing protein [Bacteroidia bacterium]